MWPKWHVSDKYQRLMYYLKKISCTFFNKCFFFFPLALKKKRLFWLLLVFYSAVVTWSHSPSLSLYLCTGPEHHFHVDWRSHPYHGAAVLYEVAWRSWRNRCKLKPGCLRGKSPNPSAAGWWMYSGVTSCIGHSLGYSFVPPSALTSEMQKICHKKWIACSGELTSNYPPQKKKKP